MAVVKHAQRLDRKTELTEQRQREKLEGGWRKLKRARQKENEIMSERPKEGARQTVLCCAVCGCGCD